MAKRVEIGGVFYRKRRGVLVEIPAQWVGKTLHPQSKRKRDSKQPAPVRKLQRRPSKSGCFKDNYFASRL